MEFNYLVEKKRMLDSLGREGYVCSNIDCNKCPLIVQKDGKELHCEEFEIEYPLEATEIVRKWAEEHPRKTRKDVLLEKFPNAKIFTTTNGRPKLVCAEALGICKCTISTTCEECWNTEVKE